MQPWVVLERAQTPDGTELVLARRGDEFVIRAAGRELMSSRAHGSEARLAELGVAALEARAAPRVLIGGLGCGYTLAAALQRLPPQAEVHVAELSERVVAWNRGVLAQLAGRPLEDERVRVDEVDVVDLLARERAKFDLILLDVDNGPSALTQARNAWLYTEQGLTQIASALRPRGALLVWSAGPDARFTARLRAQRFRVVEERVRAHATGSGKWHTIWVATLGEDGSSRPRARPA
jgi:spermidine synthase